MRALSLPSYLRLTRASAAYDIVVAAPLATPWTFALFHTQLSAVNGALGAGPLPPFAPLHFLLTALLGTLVLLWSVCRFTGPSLRLGRFDAAGRLVFSAWLAWALAGGALPVLWLFLAPELCWGVAQWWPVTRAAGTQRPALAPA
ncbi:hypothetical protein [Massilia niastensis]|uniref:hypothetical protein n=1 Tax=Massilia niastensis TaxID=544911 RepID=UPI00037E7B77|nr:hypothetical protein [Massilia niastensis]